MRALVTGGRSFGEFPINATEAEIELALDQRNYIWVKLTEFHSELNITELCQGAAAGADSWAGKWAEANHIPCQVFPANWKEHGRAAGPIRNREMLVEFQPDIVLAFPGGRGTANMCKQAAKYGITVEALDGTH